MGLCKAEQAIRFLASQPAKPSVVGELRAWLDNCAITQRTLHPFDVLAKLDSLTGRKAKRRVAKGKK